MSIVMLPQTIRRDGQAVDCQWPHPDAGGVTRLTPQSIVTNLVWADVIDPRGVPSPWSPAIAFGWMLSNAESDATEVLRLLLIGIHLAVFQQQEIELSARGGTLLQQTLLRGVGETASAVGSKVSVYLWPEPVWSEIRPSKKGPFARVVAAGVGARWPLFPSTSYQQAEGLRAIRDALILTYGEATTKRLLTLSGERVEFRDAAHKASFTAVIKELATDPIRVEQAGPWRTALRVIVGELVQERK